MQQTNDDGDVRRGQRRRAAAVRRHRRNLGLFLLVELVDDLLNVDDVLVVVKKVLGREARPVARVPAAQAHGCLNNVILNFLGNRLGHNH